MNTTTFRCQPISTYYDSGQNQSAALHCNQGLCFQCSGGPAICTSCPTNFDLIGSICCPKSCTNCYNLTFCTSCKPTYYLDGTNCLDCPLHCETCLMNRICLVCLPGYIANRSHQCQCEKGKLIGTICCNIPNCISAILGPNNQVLCQYCQITSGYQGPPSNNQCVCWPHFQSNGTYCNQVCGDGLLFNAKTGACDDGNKDNGDGCSSKCTIQPFFQCFGGNSTYPSICYYIGRISLSVYRITRAYGENQAIFQFNVQPFSSINGNMDLEKYINLTCTIDTNVLKISYSQINGILTVNTDYKSDLQQASCQLTVSFDLHYIHSNSATLAFDVVSSNYPLIYADLPTFYKVRLCFKYLGIIAIVLFALSLTHKMIGAQLMVCCQIVYLSNSFYNHPSVNFSSVLQFGLVSGGWSFFHTQANNNLLKPFTQRVQINPQFFQNQIFVVSALSFLLFTLFILNIYFKLKNSKDKTIQKPNSTITAFSYTEKAIVIMYRFFVFPIVSGFFIILSISAFIYSKRLVSDQNGRFSETVNALSLLFVWTMVGAIFCVEFCAKMTEINSIHRLLFGLQKTANWYIPIFLVKVIVLTILTLLGISFTYNAFLYIIAAFDIMFLIIVLFFRPYSDWYHQLAMLIGLFAQLFSIILPLVQNYLKLSEIMLLLYILILIGLLICTFFFTFLRIILTFKQLIINFMTNQITKNQKDLNIKQNLAQQQKLQKNSKLDTKNENPYRLHNIEKRRKLFIDTPQINQTDKTDEVFLTAKQRLTYNFLQKKLSNSEKMLSFQAIHP